jgi:alkanesulfonate monooxygenase SsuD/methylene tetrahydromethanopterin reductase-like flavin-dependent oxidoreductase (luciferase family)
VAPAKSLAAIDLLSGGRLVAKVGPGSSARDYAAVGIPLMSAGSVQMRRCRLSGLGRVRRSRVSFAPRKAYCWSLTLHKGLLSGSEVGVGSWFQADGPRRLRLASAYNTIPEEFASAWGRLREHVQAADKDPNRLPNAIATMFFFVTEERAAAGRIIRRS